MVLKVAGGGGTAGAVNYLGTWNASTNTPTLTSGVGVKGGYYVVSVAGVTNLDGTNLWSVGDWAVFNGSIWQKVDGSTNEAFNGITVTGLTGYMYANNVSPVTASTTIPVANVTGAVPNTVNVLAGGLLTGGGALTGNVTISLANVPSGNVTGLGTMATQNANAVQITGGTINSTTETNGTYANANITSVATTFPNSYLANSNVVIGNTTVALGSTATSVGNLTLANVTISSGNSTVTNENVSYINVSGNIRTQSLTGYLYGNANTGNVSASTTIPNSGLANANVIIGNTTIALGSTVTNIGNLTLANANITSVASTFPNSYLSNSSTTLGNATLTLGSTTSSVGNLTLANVTISSVSTPITVAQGGTGANSLSANAVIVGNGTGVVTTVAPGAANNALLSNGTNWISAALPASGVTITNDTSTNGTYYVTLTTASTGQITVENVSSTKLYFNPNTGTMSALQHSSENGIHLNKNTVSANVTVGTGYNALSAGPVTVANGVSVTVASGSRWVVS